MGARTHERHWGQFAVRLSSLNGESLSSFRHRVGLANGYVSYPAIIDDRRHFDPDLCGNERESRQLAMAHGVSLEQLHQLSLRSLTNVIAADGSLRKRPAWLLKSRYDRRDAPSAMMFCPMCLAEDLTPYFRLRWRVGLLNYCPAHSIVLHDSCPECAAGVWPQVAGHRVTVLHHELSLESCPHCHALLSTAPVKRCEPDLTGQRLLDDREWLLRDGLRVPSIEVVAALDAMCHLFMRRRARQQIVRAGTTWSELAELLEPVRWNLHTADLPLSVRHRLVEQTLPLLREWPDRFLEFAQTNGLTQFHFSGSQQLHPSWMESVIKANLRKQLRGITEEQAASAVNALRAAKVRITASLVNRILKGGGQSKSVKVLMVRRFVATEKELRHLLQGLIAQSELMNRKVPASSARDHVVICVAILGRLTLYQAAALLPSALEELVPRLASAAPGSRKKLAEFLLRRWSGYQLYVGRLPAGQLQEDKLYVVGGGKGQYTAQTKLSRAMNGLDDRLARQVKVFWSPEWRQSGSAQAT